MIERPLEDGLCDICRVHILQDVCMAYLTEYGLNNMYCPHVRNCKKFHNKEKTVGLDV